jgi:uncharacterized membrane protein
LRAIELGLVSAMFLAAAATHWLWSVAGPDARIVGQSLRENQNYPTDLPLSFLLVALTLVLLGRWSACIIEVQQLEFAAILPLVLAGLLLRRRPVVSALLFGLSLRLKHLGILLLPCFLIELARVTANAAPTDRHPMGSLLRYSLLALGLPALLSMPFLLQAADGFLLSMVLSLSREASDFGAATGSPLLLASAEGSRVLLLALLLLTLLSQAKEQLVFWTASAMLLLLFVQFSPVVFGQYFIWVLSVGLIAVVTHGGTSHQHRRDSE